MNSPQTLRFNRHKIRGKLCGAYVFVGKNTPLWTAVHQHGIGDGEWSVATFSRALYIRPFQETDDGWTKVRLIKVKSGAFRLYINLDACPPIAHLPKRFSIDGTTIHVNTGAVAWVGDLPNA